MRRSHALVPFALLSAAVGCGGLKVDPPKEPVPMPKTPFAPPKPSVLPGKQPGQASPPAQAREKR